MGTGSLRLLLAATLLGGCAIDTEPIAATGNDAGFSAAPDAIPPDGPLAYRGCDVDLTCSAACAEDLDCDEEEVAEPQPDLVGLQAQAPDWADFEPFSLERGEDAWFALPAEPGTLRIFTNAAERAVVLAVYDGARDWQTVARSADGVPLVALEVTAEMQPVLRVHARGAEADLVLVLEKDD